jgi:hypothetical protein
MTGSLREKLAGVIDLGVNNSSRKEPKGYLFGSESEAIADAAIQALRTWLDANGLVVVPREANAEMQRAANYFIQHVIGTKQDLCADEVYAVFMANSPWAIGADPLSAAPDALKEVG